LIPLRDALARSETHRRPGNLLKKGWSREIDPPAWATDSELLELVDFRVAPSAIHPATDAVARRMKPRRLTAEETKDRPVMETKLHDRLALLDA